MKKSTQQVTVQNLSYAQYKAQSQSDLLLEELNYEVQAKKSEWEVSIARTKASLAQANRNLNNALRSADLNAIISAENSVASLASGLEVAEKYFAQLFPQEA